MSSGAAIPASDASAPATGDKAPATSASSPGDQAAAAPSKVAGAPGTAGVVPERPAAEVDDALRRAGVFLRRIPRIEQYRGAALGELPALLPGRVRPSIERARDQLPAAVTGMTVGDILDLTA